MVLSKNNTIQHFLKPDVIDDTEDDDIECPCLHLIGKECICDEECELKCQDRISHHPV